MEELFLKIGLMAVVIGFIVLIVYLNKTDEKRTTKRAKEAAIREKGLQKLQDYYNSEEWLHDHD